MAFILNGTKAGQVIQARLKVAIAKTSQKPTLVILQVGSRPDSTSFINRKRRFADDVGVTIVHKTYSDSVLEDELLQDIRSFNGDKDTHGIILQLPLPKHLRKDALIEAITPEKDIDGLTSKNVKDLFNENELGLVPATAKGILNLLKFYKISVTGKHVVIVGRSALVGKPTGLALLAHNATVTIAHKKTKNLAAITKTADILIVAIGDPEFITSKYVQPGQVVLDVGINPGGKKIVGDVKYKDVEHIVKAISPVPGGIGPMTVAALFENLYEAFTRQHKK